MFSGMNQKSGNTCTPLVLSKSKEVPQVVCTKTKAALCLLCLFDGLHTPTIRRLSRKPRLICNKPLLTFDPTVFAPSSSNAIQDLYSASMKCPAEIFVDPPGNKISEVIKTYSQNAKTERLIIHYFGQGCLPPTADGSLFFFSDDRSKYKPMKIETLMNICPTPLCLIVDSPSAGNILPFLQKKQDVIAFFACSPNEVLPISTDAPWDLFSSCLLSPFETAVWWHTRRHSCVFKGTENSNHPNYFLKKFLFALLDAIAFDTQPATLFDILAKDTAMTQLARGFILSMRIMQSFNLHPISIPEHRPTSSHDLWLFWDTALDCSLAMSDQEAATMIFQMFIKSFKSFPTVGVMPIFSFFITRAEFCEAAVSTLCNFLDTHGDLAIYATRSNIAKTIIEMDKPSESAILLLAKILSISSGTGAISPFQQQWLFWFQDTKESSVSEIKAGMLAIICAISWNFLSIFTKIWNVCVEKAQECAPYSSILLGLLLGSAGRLMNLPPFGQNFYPLLDNSSYFIRASTVFLLGMMKDRNMLDKLFEMLENDDEPIVRQQIVVSLSRIQQYKHDDAILDNLNKIKATEKDEEVLKLINLALEGKYDEVQEECSILKMVIEAVKSNGFIEKYYCGTMI
ncbi:TOR signaling [Trichomonas vaginalis G3]|uniref:TOR signaling n=1 Tax=Trichomonas vaginalis (strain ATCC PRA-98 / G3) TaxID=412133 RepID=UPI0021E560B5|nr:TOR signaling [Trichomonas vaginalis G3]KAI5489030.1 TOR signaling [Trichomonas vaginalis G3]